MSLEFQGALVPYSSPLGVVSSDIAVSTCSPVFIAEVKRLHKYSSIVEVKVTHNGSASTGEQTLVSIKPFFTNTIDSANPPIRDAELAFYDEKDEESLTYVKKFQEIRVKASSLPCTFKVGETKSFYPKIDKYPDGTTNLDYIGFEIASNCQVFRVTPKPHLGIRAKIFPQSIGARVLFDKLKNGSFYFRSFNMYYYGLSNVSNNKYPRVADLVIKEEIPMVTKFVVVLNEVAQGGLDVGNPSSPVITLPFQFPDSSLNNETSINVQFNPLNTTVFPFYQNFDKFSYVVRVGYSYTASGTIIYDDFYL